MVVLIDNGHGRDTKGKCSPILDASLNTNKNITEDNRLKEYKYTRIVAAEIVEKLKKAYGIDARLVTPEEKDISLVERVKRINKVCTEKGARNVLMISVHCNAASDGAWSSGTGWEAYTTKGATISDNLATCLYKRAEKNFPGKKIRADYSDGDPDKEANFYIIKGANCAAVLSENFFMDNKNDVKYMLSDDGLHAIVRTHIEGILDYIEKYSKR